eukprot:CAMPEP_0206296142 /NCGR_PEP_ID=MMETSP0106_2-20121207/5520_1 /ASSEMBLY_ACC=CAM_ASM_000206 /TAXON_ID=81532 /ORGANISM="Acanthoeca-like sp., Strain 10tr" /LENGTH=64 /DNA_ID=CAMNT_0053726799 /DNA_START=42 /DNA_END=236 /DNA_ORIENTATION=+
MTVSEMVMRATPPSTATAPTSAYVPASAKSPWKLSAVCSSDAIMRPIARCPAKQAGHKKPAGHC